MTTISTDDEEFAIFTAILDTGAGPNLVREDVLPKPSLPNLQPMRVSIRAAGDTTIRVEGVIRSTVKIGGHKASTGFVVASKLATKGILGTVFMDKELSWIKKNCWQIIQRNGYAVVIVKNFEEKDAVQLSTRAVKKPGGAI